MFLSRIHEKKGCDMLIEAFGAVAGQDDRLHLVVAGPGPPNLIKRLQARARRLAVDQRITWVGMVSGEMKWGAFRSAELFVLPTHQENFGIAIVEALTCGVPVAISDKVNIHREIAAEGGGLVGNDTVMDTTKILQRWIALPETARQEMAKKARQCYLNRYQPQRAADNLINTLHSRGVTG